MSSTGSWAQLSHLDTHVQHTARLRGICPFPAHEDDAKWTRRGTYALCFEGIEKCVEISESDFCVFIFGGAGGRGTQGPDARVMFRDRFLERRRIGQKVFMLDCGKFGVRRGGIVG